MITIYKPNKSKTYNTFYDEPCKTMYTRPCVLVRTDTHLSDFVSHIHKIRNYLLRFSQS